MFEKRFPYSVYPTSSVDIVPTILSHLNGEEVLSSIDFDGQPLFSRSKDAFIISEAPAYGYSNKASVIKWPHKLIISPQDNVSHVFNLADDPNEEHLIESETLRTDLESSYVPLLSTDGSPYEKPVELDEAVKNQLANLGYM